MRRQVLATFCAAALAGSLWLAVPAGAAGRGVTTSVSTSASSAAKRPATFTSVTASPGPGVGKVTFTWKQTGAYTTGYQLETALSMFSTTSATLPDHGRQATTFAIDASARRSRSPAARQLKPVQRSVRETTSSTGSARSTR